MKKIYCLTFHASYNYGSALQTYALEEFIVNNFHSQYFVVNLRTDYQKRLYKTIYDNFSFKNLFCRLFTIGKKKQIAKKNRLFEDFFKQRFKLTDEIDSIEKFALSFNQETILLCGSDQIWNLNAKDFDWSYFLDFAMDVKKVSYACSMGSKQLVLSENEKDRIKRALKSFANISVRDLNTKRTIESLGYNPYLVCDPTILLRSDEWKKIVRAPSSAVPKKDYILFYDLKRDRSNWKIARSISRLLKMPIIITSVPYPRTISKSFGMIKRFDTGPSEFLYYLSNASLVLSSSYHGCIFSCIFEKPFYSINSENDERIKCLLKDVSLENRNIKGAVCLDTLKEWSNIDFTKKRRVFKEAANNAFNYLEKAING